MADSGTKNFGSILSTGLYRIPNYQRGYAWTSREVNDLLDDLEYVTENESVEDHYLNSIIVTEADDESLADKLYVIDGQQRLLTSNLLAHEILRKAFELDSGDDQNTNHLKTQVESKLYTGIYKSGSSRVTRRVIPAEEHQEIFKELVPTDLEAERDLEAIIEAADSPSEQKLAKAVQIITNRLDDILNNLSSSQDKLLYLDRLASTLHNDFTATLHEVKSPSEAGRIFEAINDRGRNLNRADKIKSYLVYRATLGDVSVGVEDIHETFTQIYEVLNDYASNPAKVDELIDRLVGQHWNMFAGEDKISRSDDLIGRHKKASEDIDQIKHATYHISKHADDARVGRWINAYLKSLRAAADAYVYVRGTDQEEIFNSFESQLSDDLDASNVRHYLYAIEKFGPSTTHSLSMALYLRFGKSESYEMVTKELEKLIIRIFGVGGARRDTKRRQFESLSRVLFWENRDDITDVFPKQSSIPSGVSKDASNYGINGSSDDANQIQTHLKKWAHNYSHETEDGKEIDIFKQRLMKDNLNGLGVAGWSGLSSGELKNYMLYNYEAQIRCGGAELPKYLDAGIYDYTVEHVWPKKRGDFDIANDLDDDTYAHYVDRLGNLAFLSLSENSTANNHEYKKKWESTYKDARDGTKMVRNEFPDPTGEKTNEASEAGFETWGSDVIDWRSESMAEVLAEYWRCGE
ncbi:DUF262 domain-containing protein [Halorubraceae archaeon YAN]|nr:DUF262 domain-containing protein [Halorubraceae archaeon YAN]